MSEFVVNDDMFGGYCEIATDFSRGLHIYKIVGLIESNSYCDIPLTYQSKPTYHKDIVPVLLVIHCGIDETRVQRVALSNCKVRLQDVQERAEEYRLKIENLQNVISNQQIEISAKIEKQIKAEAYKEFAERLKETSVLRAGCVPWYEIYAEIDYLLKEMVSEDE